MFRFKKSKLPDYVKKKIWLKSYPPDFPKKIKIPKKPLPEVFREAAEKSGDVVSLIFYGKEYTCLLYTSDAADE